jgi:hypothetical protein
VEEHNPIVRKLERVKKPIRRYIPPNFLYALVLNSIDDEPNSFSEVVDSTEGKLWKDVMVKEMESLHKNKTWDLFKLTSGRNPISIKWVFKKNMKFIGQVEKFKAQLVAKGYSQVKVVEFGDIFPHVAKLTFIRVLMYLPTTFDLEIEQMDGKIVFLHGDLEEEMYMKQLEGFVVKGKKELVCKLKRSLYGLNQSPRMWYQKFDIYILSLGFVISKVDHCIYSKEEGGCFIYVALYVDDMLLIGNNMDAIKEVKK